MQAGTSVQFQTAADLHELLNAWARTWAKEKGSVLDWIEYEETKLDERLLHTRCSSCCGPSKLFDKGYFLSLKNPTEFDVDIETSIDAAPKSFLVGEFEEPNETSQKRTIEVVIEEGWEERRSISDVFKRTVNLSLELSGGFPPFANLSAIASLAFERTKGENAEYNRSSRITVTRLFDLVPHATTRVKIISWVQESKAKIRCRVYLTGYLVICCRNKVKHHSDIAGRKGGEHYKWAVPIHEVFNDLRRHFADQNNPVISEQDKAIIQASLPAFICDENQNVCFYYESSVNTVKNLKGVSKVEVIPLPGYEAPLAAFTLGAVPSTKEPAISVESFTEAFNRLRQQMPGQESLPQASRATPSCVHLSERNSIVPRDGVTVVDHRAAAEHNAMAAPIIGAASGPSLVQGGTSEARHGSMAGAIIGSDAVAAFFASRQQGAYPHSNNSISNPNPR